jgi:hypothetical protein
MPWRYKPILAGLSAGPIMPGGREVHGCDTSIAVAPPRFPITTDSMSIVKLTLVMLSV